MGSHPFGGNISPCTQKRPSNAERSSLLRQHPWLWPRRAAKTTRQARRTPTPLLPIRKRGSPPMAEHSLQGTPVRRWALRARPHRGTKRPRGRRAMLHRAQRRTRVRWTHHPTTVLLRHLLRLTTRRAHSRVRMTQVHRVPSRPARVRQVPLRVAVRLRRPRATIARRAAPARARTTAPRRYRRRTHVSKVVAPMRERVMQGVVCCVRPTRPMAIIVTRWS
jgi:hypothetical protein